MPMSIQTKFSSDDFTNASLFITKIHVDSSELEGTSLSTCALAPGRVTSRNIDLILSNIKGSYLIHLS